MHIGRVRATWRGWRLSRQRMDHGDPAVMHREGRRWAGERPAIPDGLAAATRPIASFSVHSRRPMR